MPALCLGLWLGRWALPSSQAPWRAGVPPPPRQEVRWEVGGGQRQAQPALGDASWWEDRGLRGSCYLILFQVNVLTLGPGPVKPLHLHDLHLPLGQYFKGLPPLLYPPSWQFWVRGLPPWAGVATPRTRPLPLASSVTSSASLQPRLHVPSAATCFPRATSLDCFL